MLNQIEKLGMAVCIISNEMIPVRWMMHQQMLHNTFPSGLYWQYVYSIGDVKTPGVTYALLRTDVVNKALSLNVKWILFIDTDVFLPFDAVSRLMSHEVDIVCGVYWMKTNPPQPVVFDKLGNGPIWNIKPQNKLLEISGSGLGCCLIKTTVFEKFKEKGILFFDQDWTATKNEKNIRVKLGEDHWFFDKARELGFKIWCDTNINCDHYDYNNKIMYPGLKTALDLEKQKLKDIGGQDVIDHQNSLLNMDKHKPTFVFFNHCNVPFSGASIEEKPIAGSETAVINMAKEIKNMNCNVHVFCNADKEGLFDMVSYHSNKKVSEMIDIIKTETGKDIDYFISSRNLDPFLGGRPPAKKTILWVHDMPDPSQDPGASRLKQALPNIDQLFFVSNYQAQEYQHFYNDMIPQDKVYITRNGLDVSRFKKNKKKIKGKCIYTTTPFRGLDILLGLWPRIQAKVPYATLDIYSGMSIYNMNEYEETQKVFDYGKQIIDKYKYNITFHQPVKQDKLAEIMEEAELMLYPNHFKETSCITIMEAMEARTPVITSNLGAIPETLGINNGILIDGDPYSQAYMDMFVDAAVNYLTSDNKPEMVIPDLSWKKIAEEWINRLGGTKVRVLKTKEGKQNINTSDYWNYKYSNLKQVFDLGAIHKGLKERIEFISKMIPENSSILDIGCGFGEFLKYLSQNNIGKKWFGMDISSKVIEICKNETSNITFIEIPEGANPLPAKNLSVITAIHLIEHLENPEDYINQWKKSLAPGGKMILVIPLEDEEYIEHLKIYTMKDITALAEKITPRFKIITRKQGWKYDSNREATEAIVELLF